MVLIRTGHILSACLQNAEILTVWWLLCDIVNSWWQHSQATESGRVPPTELLSHSGVEPQHGTTPAVSDSSIACLHTIVTHTTRLENLTA